MNVIKLLAKYHAALDARDLATVEQMLAQEARYISVGLGDVKGRDAIMLAMSSYFSGNPDHQAFDDLLEQRDDRTAVSHWRLRATNKGTGAVMERHGRETVTFDSDGLIERIEVDDA